MRLCTLTFILCWYQTEQLRIRLLNRAEKRTFFFCCTINMTRSNYLVPYNGVLNNLENTTASPHNVCVTACSFIVNVLDLPFASPFKEIWISVYKSTLNKR